ncbi:hypothetical protein PA598K_06193 [Paenibacillus sp. 598K]|nr:hypothetical protein PA598K_06193 [Paenibacillus sp. 598K]
MIHHREQAYGSNPRHGDRNEDPKHNLEMAGSIDKRRFLQFLWQVPKEVQQQNNIKYRYSSREHQGRERINQSKKANGHVPWNEAAANEYGDDKIPGVIAS